MAGAASGGAPKRHHYVPQWHLRRFTPNADGTIWRYSKSNDDYVAMAVKNAAVITHYYSIATDEGHDPKLERALAELDGRAAQVFPKLEMGKGVDEHEVEALAAYTAMLHGRVPPARDGQQRVLEVMGALQIEMTLANARSRRQRKRLLKGAKRSGLAERDEDFDVFSARITEELRKGDARVVHEPIATMGAAGIGMAQATPILRQMPRMVIEGPPRAEFVISDNPVCLYSPATPSYMGVGFLTADVEVTVPLSSRHLLLFSHNHWYQGACCVIEDAVDHFNNRTWLSAGDYVFASSRRALERAAATLTPDDRRRPGGGVEITGYP